MSLDLRYKGGNKGSKVSSYNGPGSYIGVAPHRVDFFVDEP